jgi:hypothetical protein
MKFDMDVGKKLIEELVDLWNDCSIRCEKIEQLVKQLKEEPEK